MKLVNNPKVLFILNLPPPIHGSSVIGQYIFESNIIKSKFNGDFVNLNISRRIEDIGRKNPFKILTYIKVLFNVISKLFVNRYDLCYITLTSYGIAFYKDSLIVFLVKCFGVKKIVFHLHNKGIKNYQHKRFDNFLYRRVFEKSNAILLSDYLYPDVEKYLRKDEVYFCPNGVPNNFTKVIRSYNRVCQLLFFSNLMKEKGVFDLLSACHLLKQRGNNFICHFVGKISDVTEKEFNVVVQKLNLTENVFFLGAKYGDDKNLIFSLSDIFVFPTYYKNECFPLVLLEAMSFGLPIVSTIEGGIRDIVKHGESGYLVEQRDIKGLANYLELLINNKELRINMGAESQNVYREKFNLPIFEENFSRILSTIYKSIPSKSK